jgi:hypothetical protein
MRTGHFLTAAITGVMLLAAPCAFAQTLYKLIDKDGKITYSQEKPKNFDGQVIQLNIDPNANTATLPSGAKATAPAPAPRKNAAAAEYQVAQAKDRLEKAKSALQDAKDNPGEKDQQILGNKGGGVRFIPTEEYQARIKQLEQNVKDAEDNLARVEKGG